MRAHPTQSPSAIARLLNSLSRAVVLLALATFGIAQETQHSPGKTHQDSIANVADLPAQANVIEVRYDCKDQPATGNDGCLITVSKQQFDALVQALDPNMNAAGRQSLATEYSRLLIMAAQARERGIDQQPEMQTLLQFSTLQLLAMRLVREISTKPSTVSAADVDGYFRDHPLNYQEVLLSKIVVPAGQKTPDHGGLTATERAQGVYQRARNGEDFAALQSEINGSHAAIAASNKAWLRCGSLPEAHRQVCGLEPGQISKPIADGQNYFIYRLDARRILKLKDVHAEIRSLLERDRVESEIRRVRTPVSLQLDERYFGQLPEPDVAKKHGLHYPATAPPAAQHKH